MPELIDLTLAPAELAGVETLLENLEAALPFLVSLSPEQVKALFKLGPQSEAFVQKTLNAAEQHGRLLPASTSVAVMQRDAALRAALRPIRARVAALLEKLDGTMLLAGADLMKSTSAVYRTLRIHAKGEGIEELLEDLGKRFAKRRKVGAKAAEVVERRASTVRAVADSGGPVVRQEVHPACTDADATLEHGVLRADAFTHAPPAGEPLRGVREATHAQPTHGANAGIHKSPRSNASLGTPGSSLASARSPLEEPRRRSAFRPPLPPPPGIHPVPPPFLT